MDPIWWVYIVLGFGIVVYPAAILYLSICAKWSVRQWFVDLAGWAKELDKVEIPTRSLHAERNESSSAWLVQLFPGSEDPPSSNFWNRNSQRRADLFLNTKPVSLKKVKKKSTLPSSGLPSILRGPRYAVHIEDRFEELP